MHSLLQDLRYALRMLVKNPGFTIVVVVCLALGIGANTAVFSVVNGVLLRPLGYPDENRLVRCFGANKAKGLPRTSVCLRDFTEWCQQNNSFVDMGIYTEETHNFTGGDQPRRLEAVCATGSLLPLLGFEARIGRIFGPEEDRPGREPVALLSDGFWRRDFGADPAIVGRTILLDDTATMVLGVLPRELEKAWGEFDMWLPLPEYIHSHPSYMTNPLFYAVGRLKPGVGVAQAQTEMEGIALRLAEAYPDTNRDWTVQIVPFIDIVVDKDTRLALYALIAAVVFVLLIACVNVANLLLAKATVRQREFAVRSALGAGRWRLVRQMIVEYAVLALAGGVIGVLLTVWGVDVLTSFLPEGFPRRNEIGVDQRVLVFTIVLSLATGVLCGLVPALKTTSAYLVEMLKDTARTGSAGGSGRLRRALRGVGQLALTLALVTCAGLMIKSFLRLQAVDPGFDARQLITMRADLSRYEIFDSDSMMKRTEFFRQVTEEIRRTPGVTAAAAVSTLPLADGGVSQEVIIEDHPLSDSGETIKVGSLTVTPGYFETMRIPLVSGRDFTEQDILYGEHVVIVNQRMAEQFWPNQEAVGKHLRFATQQYLGPWCTVIGVVGNVKHYGLDSDLRFEVYKPHAQSPTSLMRLIARTTGDPLAMAAAVQNAIWNVDPAQPVYSVRSMEDFVFEDIGARCIYAGLLGAFATIGIVLTAAGIYGVMSYTVARRTQEIGIRMALGAQARDVMWLVLTRSVLLTLFGVAGGIGLALLLGSALRSLMYRVSPTDPITFIGVGIVMTVVSLLASYLPARRATKVDPMIALRCE